MAVFGRPPNMAKNETTKLDAAFGRPPYTAKKETTKLDMLNGGLQPPAVHCKNGK